MMEALSLRRFLLVSVAIPLLCLSPSLVVGQFPYEQDKNLIIIAKGNLEEAQKEFAARLAKLEESGLLKPENDDALPIDQPTWEKLPYIEGDLPESVFAAFKTPEQERSESQDRILLHYYLSHVRKDTRSELKAISNRVHWLQRYIAASTQGEYDAATYRAAVALFYRQQFLDPYLFHTKDSGEIQERACDLFRNMSNDRGKFNFGSPEAREKCRFLENLENLDPVLRVATIDQRLFHRATPRDDPREKQLNKAIQTFEDLGYGPFLKLQARHALYDWKTIQARRILSTSSLRRIGERDDPVARAISKELDDIADEIFADAIEVMREVGDCPELSRTLFFMMVRTFRIESQEKKQELLKLIAESDLQPWAKSYYLQFANVSMAQRSSAGSYIEDSIKHGKQAFELLPLSPEPSLRLMLYENTFADTKKWFHESLGRQIDSEQVIKAFYELASKSDDPQTAVADLMVSLSKSQRYDLKIPENVIVMLKRFKGKSDFGLICQNEEVQKALERVVKGGVKNGGDEKWLKEARQLQVEVGVKGGHFDRAFAVAKLLEGDLGSFNSYRGRPLTLSRMACLGNEFVESIEDKIDEGTVDLDSIPQTIENLELVRQDLGTIAGTYTDELILLLESILLFESGDWAELTKSNDYMLFWRQRYQKKVEPLKDGVHVLEGFADLRWRWPFESAYVLEADIQFSKEETKTRNKMKAGFRTNANTLETAFVNLESGFTGLSRGWPRGAIQWHRFSKENEGNRVRIRVWPDYCDFSVDNEELFYQVNPFPVDLGARLYSFGDDTKFRNVRIRKLRMKSPAKFRGDPVKYWDSRIKDEPDAGELLRYRARALIKSGLAEKNKEFFNRAVEDLRRTTDLVPGSAEGFLDLIDALAYAKRYSEAKDEAVAAVKKFSGRRELKIRLAALECASSDPELLDGKSALKLSKKLLNSPRGLNKTKLLELAAAAHAQAEMFSKAIEFQREAIALQPHRQRLKQTLADYEQEKPLRVELDYFSNRYDSPDVDGERKAMVVTKGLVRHWPFDEDVDEKVTKSAGEIAGNSRLVGGRCRGAILLGEGSGGNSVQTNSEPIDQYKDFTISFWVNRINGHGGLISISPESSDSGLFLYLHSGELKFRVEQHKKLSAKVLEGAGKNKQPLKIDAHKWVHYTLTYDSKKYRYQTWVDGAKVAEQVALPDDGDLKEKLDPDSLKIKFGNSREFFGFGGRLDEVRFYDRVLTDDEVKKVKNYRP